MKNKILFITTILAFLTTFTVFANQGEITIYSGRSEILIGPVFERFTAETGIRINVNYGGTAELAATILEEGQNSPADVFFAQDAGALGVLLNIDNPLIVPLKEINTPDGCGKTTLLRLLAGLERPDKGKILLRGKTVAGNNRFISPEKRGVGMVFQDYALFPHLNVWKNVAFGFKAKEKRKNRSKIQKTIQLVGLTGMEKKYPAELSGGQQQRVALARSLVLDPLLVLLDEPFSNLDVHLRDKMRHDITKIIRQSKATAIFVTHDQIEALTISDKIVVMNQGQVEQIGSPREIYQLPETKFVASFVGQSNILTGIIGKDSKSIITEIGKIPCQHTHDRKPGDRVSLSIRPDSLEYDPDGPIEGIVAEYSYRGINIDVTISVNTKSGKKKLLVHVHPEFEVKKGNKLRFKVLLDFVAVIPDVS